MSKLTEVITEVIHTACQAELDYDEELQRKSLVDIYETIGKVLKRPADESVRVSTGEAAAKRSLESCATSRPADEPTDAGRESLPVQKNPTTEKGIKWPEGFSLELEKNGRKLVGVITECGAYIDDDTYPYRYYATVYDGDDILFSIDSCARGLCFQRKVLKSAMHEAIMMISHRRRYRANKKEKLRRAAILTPAEEVAETVRRQQEGDEA